MYEVINKLLPANKIQTIMDFQFGFNIALGLIAFLGGWILNNLRDNLKDLYEKDNTQTDKIQDIHILVAGEYVKREELEKLSIAIFNKLDKIEHKLDAKLDKRDQQ
ncbi:hypothetical protein UFOVP1666_80 [uncultured Caudovirales phage]|uniref:Uncharacterized protein n=1 Tax=uncultured Caudovirales phage TaxID=2100421 RepID=A0A6J5PNU4_9CAUD|nr:hypothetical protein UFOVP867_35 [uncultured Caudovirales phage]CAB4171001.1 hypothetical protein UFOVP913_163 [uncultured Caudovirales phage]CAB4176303.1 hypothetical protein UFOVP993_19 [uncultured Caudovirales phage]CAB4223037.1 hypothetical protein UFOVP1666_80 [uncultured Caudovirales phage]